MHLVSFISVDCEEELFNYWPPVPSVYPQMTQINIGTSSVMVSNLNVCLTVRPEVTWHVDCKYS